MANDSGNGDGGRRPAGALRRGVTLRSTVVLLAALLVMGAIIQFTGVIEASLINKTQLAAHALALPAVMVFVVVLCAVGVVFRLTRCAFLTRAEMLCLLYALLIAAPIMSTGFWHTLFRGTATIPRTASFDKMDALSENLWPHGRNLTPDALAEGNRGAVWTSGNASWEPFGEHGRRLLTLSNAEEGAVSAARIKVPLEKEGEPFLLLGEPYLASVMAHARNLGRGASYYARLYCDEKEEFGEELFSTAQPAEVNYLHQDGFVRLGSYGVVMPNTVERHVYVEYGLAGPGEVVFKDPVMMSVGGLENLMVGRRIISQSDYDRLPESEKRTAQPGNTSLVVRPDNMWSFEGLKFILTGYIPARQWVRPILCWGSYIALLLAATFGMAAIMRRQWLDNERYPMPVAQVAMAFVGRDVSTASPFSRIWHRRALWFGFAPTVLWCILRGWNLYNPRVPLTWIFFDLSQYLENPWWGQTWTGIVFSVTALFLAMAMYMELNVLLSIVVGFLLFRLQFWFGYNYLAMGKTVGPWPQQPTYPFGPHQMVASFLVYGALVLFFSRKYLWRVAKEVIGIGKRDVPGTEKAAVEHGTRPAEAMSYRWAVLLLAGAFIGVYGWSRWMDIPAWGMLALFLFFVALGFVAAKIRVECGAPFAGYFPLNVTLAAIPLLGGMAFLAPTGVVFATAAMTVFLPAALPAVFFFLPGLQVELIELGRQYGVLRRHIAYTCVLGVGGGLLVGGWIFLSSMYGMGAENAGEQMVFSADRTVYRAYEQELKDATARLHAGRSGGALEPEEDSLHPSVWVAVIAAGATAMVTILRQLFAGFWFHPVGLILGPSMMSPMVWGSMLAACVIRTVTVKIGGAVAVRDKLLPFFVGVFLGGAAGHFLMMLFNGYMYFFNPSAVRFGTIL